VVGNGAYIFWVKKAPACTEEEEREAGANRSFYNFYESNYVFVLKKAI